MKLFHKDRKKREILFLDYVLNAFCNKPLIIVFFFVFCFVFVGNSVAFKLLVEKKSRELDARWKEGIVLKDFDVQFMVFAKKFCEFLKFRRRIFTVLF